MPHQRGTPISGCACKRKQIYLYCPSNRSKLTCLIHGNLSHSLDQCKALRDFGKRYAEGRPLKLSIYEPTIKKNIRKQEANAMSQHAVEEILQENIKR